MSGTSRGEAAKVRRLNAICEAHRLWQRGEIGWKAIQFRGDLSAGELAGLDRAHKTGSLSRYSTGEQLATVVAGIVGL